MKLLAPGFLRCRSPTSATPISLTRRSETCSLGPATTPRWRDHTFQRRRSLSSRTATTERATLESQLAGPKRFSNVNGIPPCSNVVVAFCLQMVSCSFYLHSCLHVLVANSIVSFLHFSIILVLAISHALDCKFRVRTLTTPPGAIFNNSMFPP